jgi:hypothetical protein
MLRKILLVVSMLILVLAIAFYADFSKDGEDSSGNEDIICNISLSATASKNSVSGSYNSTEHIRKIMSDIPVSVEQEFVHQDPSLEDNIVINFNPTVTIENVKPNPHGGYFVYLAVSGDFSSSIGEEEITDTINGQTSGKTGHGVLNKILTFKNAAGQIIETKTIGLDVWFTKCKIAAFVHIYQVSNIAMPVRSDCCSCPCAFSTIALDAYPGHDVLSDEDNGIVFTILDSVRIRSETSSDGNLHTEDWILNVKTECPNGQTFYATTYFARISEQRSNYRPSNRYGMGVHISINCPDGSCVGNTKLYTAVPFHPSW